MNIDEQNELEIQRKIEQIKWKLIKEYEDRIEDYRMREFKRLD